MLFGVIVRAEIDRSLNSKVLRGGWQGSGLQNCLYMWRTAFVKKHKTKKLRACFNLRESCRQGFVLTIYQGRIDLRRSGKVMGVLRTTKKHIKKNQEMIPGKHPKYV